MIFIIAFVVLIASFASAQQHPQIPCGLPPFVDRMKDTSAAQLRAIWQDYQAGADCSAQQQQTFAIVHSLTDSERTYIFGVPPPKPKSMQDSVPKFLRNSEPKFRQQFDKLWGSTTLAAEDKFRTLEALAQENLSSQQLGDFHQWLHAVKTQKRTMDRRIDSLSDEARQVFSAVVQLRAQEQKLLTQSSPSVIAELKGLL
uniref:DUF148 domain-containing protein n=1 Tax=Steinernema glaseri TaxID=37863 RepID=A0A1I8AX55_9BILA